MRSCRKTILNWCSCFFQVAAVRVLANKALNLRIGVAKEMNERNHKLVYFKQ